MAGVWGLADRLTREPLSIGERSTSDRSSRLLAQARNSTVTLEGSPIGSPS